MYPGAYVQETTYRTTEQRMGGGGRKGICTGLSSHMQIPGKLGEVKDAYGNT